MELVRSGIEPGDSGNTVNGDKYTSDSNSQIVYKKVMFIK